MARRVWLVCGLIALAALTAADARADFAEARAAFNSGQFEKAHKLLEPLAEEGDPRAQYALGAMYHNGLSVEKDYDIAEGHYRAAAEQGYPSAQFGLGALYEAGRGVPQDFAEAAEWYRRAAEQTDIESRWPGNRGPRDGAAFAQNALGRLYETGRGVPQDLEEAEKWYRMAADYGYAPAAENLERLLGESAED